MRSRQYRAVSALLVMAGIVVVAAWIGLAGGRALLTALARLRPATGLLLVAITCACVLLRFLRWQYLCRRVGVRVATRRSLTIYLASLAGIATPAYIGETLRCALLRREFGAPLRRTLPIWFTERVLDFAAIGVLAAAGASGSVLVFALVLAAIVLLIVAGELVPSRDGVAWDRARRAAFVLPVFGLSLAAWLPAMLVVTLAASGLGAQVGVLDGVRVFGTATLGGGLSLLPAGMVAMGGLAIVQLEALGLALADAVATVSVVRLATAGITLAIGGVFLLREIRVLAAGRREDRHFDAIADQYLDQFAPHIWDLLLARKTALITDALGPAATRGTGVDLGCGLGLQADTLRERGYRVVGVEPAFNLLSQARPRPGNPASSQAPVDQPAVAGSALALPFADGSVDFVYTVGVLHHLDDEREQVAACTEVARVLRPGGTFIVHETNPNNPLFRLYMSYLFPVLRSIDEGIEHWIPVERWALSSGFRLENVRYFTFLPDFLPRVLVRLALPLERWLERGRLRRYSVHYMAVLRRTGPAPATMVATASAAVES
ncbi:MAG: methyltransferase domain-containing protein [Gemmatimonadetes bacterium]|nr:methyltransferase domain-containing protein [Gemmatimonadota bacterium]